MPDIAGFFARVRMVDEGLSGGRNNPPTTGGGGVRGMARAKAKGKASNTIAFQGEPGANSDMACRARFPT